MIHEKQQQSNWCWVACFRMACSYFGLGAPDECSIAGQFLGVNGCCPPGANSSCNRTISDAMIPALYSSQALVASAMPASDAAFQQALSANRLILVLIAYPATYHFILITACSGGSYTVDDPEFDAAFPATYTQILNYPMGSLDKAWTVAQP